MRHHLSLGLVFRIRKIVPRVAVAGLRSGDLSVEMGTDSERAFGLIPVWSLALPVQILAELIRKQLLELRIFEQHFIELGQIRQITQQVAVLDTEKVAIHLFLLSDLGDKLLQPGCIVHLIFLSRIQAVFVEVVSICDSRSGAHAANRPLRAVSIVIGDPVVYPLKTPDTISTTSPSFLCVEIIF